MVNCELYHIDTRPNANFHQNSMNLTTRKERTVEV